MYERKEVVGNWVFNFRRRLYDWEDCEGAIASAGPSMRISKLIWVKYLPPKFQFFGWPAWKNRIKTSVFLQRIGVLHNNVSTLCVFCKAVNETVDHVMVSCPFVWNVWAEMLNWWDVQGALPGSVEVLILWWDEECFSSKERKIWRGIPLVVLWSVWKLRNDVVFNASNPSLAELCEVIKVRVALWLKPFYTEHNFTMQEFVINLRQVSRCISGRWL
ncbi:uncharacterized protein LOC114273928 [Camellia sinensis]|uniref:uncharacterized protein LOC114273928 n=1 Tax=Camellia sinensis TaxID=4442 RepID=UPI0010365FED|nr:uncharacterized protein LOC114273928 [Camellia sinensis]